MLRRMKGFTLIELLIVVAIIAILAAIAVPNFLEAQTRAKVARVKGDQRTISLSLETYYIDQNCYPAQDSSIPGKGFGANSGLPQASTAGKQFPKMPTFRIKMSTLDALMTLTTPVAYLSMFYADPFADTKGATFSYSMSKYGTGYILWSYGPDADENDMNPTGWGGGDLDVCAPTGTPPWTFPIVAETVYNAAAQVPMDYLVKATYDPSNGTASTGDVWRVKE